jgi:2Fe-2S ferredoxin
VTGVRVTFKEADGSVRHGEGRVGQSVMELAVALGVAGIEAECGGACSCATCHVHVDEAWWERVGCCGELESDMLEFAPKLAVATSRLSCQIKLREALDGLVVAIAR